MRRNDLIPKVQANVELAERDYATRKQKWLTGCSEALGRIKAQVDAGEIPTENLFCFFPEAKPENFAPSVKNFLRLLEDTVSTEVDLDKWDYNRFVNAEWDNPNSLLEY